MEIEYKGGNCVIITHKKDSFVCDPGLSMIGLKDQGMHAAAQLLTHPRYGAQHAEETLVIRGPGEYEVRNCSVKGIAAKAHTAEDLVRPESTVYRLDIDDISIAILGHVDPKLSDTQLEAIGVVDILIIPVGGHGFSLEPKEAASIVRSIEPKLVIPTHYAQEGITYEVPQAPLADFVKELGVTPQEVQPKLKLKSGQLPETLTIQELTRTK